MEEGAASLGDAELLAIVLGTGLAGRPVGLVAAGLLEAAGGLVVLGRKGPLAIAGHPGVGLAKALRVVASIELGRRAILQGVMQHAEPPLMSSEAVARRMADVASLVSEEMWLLCLDGRNRLRARRRVAQGGLHACAVAARDILRVALCEAASAIVLVHNHPSDDPRPSTEDLAFTQRLASAADAVGVALVDHVIVTPSGRHSSMLDLGLLGEPGGSG